MHPILYMAPIRGVTNCIYRNAYTQIFQGYDVAVTPFINSGLIENRESRAVRDLFPHRNSTLMTLVPQILGNDAEGLIAVAQVVSEMGYPSVNWNLGCPHKRVTNKRRGSGLLSEPETILRVLDEIIPAIPGRLSLKVRLGKDNPLELSKLLPRLDDYPLEEIIIHPRTATQMYQGSANVDAFEAVVGLTRHRVVYNGDIDSLEKFHALEARFPTIHRWMIGRFGIINPFLAEQIKGRGRSTDSVRIERFFQLHEALYKAYEVELDGPAHLLSKMKETWLYWSEAFEGGRRLHRKISKTASLAAYRALVEGVFNEAERLIV